MLLVEHLSSHRGVFIVLDALFHIKHRQPPKAALRILQVVLKACLGGSGTRGILLLFRLKVFEHPIGIRCGKGNRSQNVFDSIGHNLFTDKRVAAVPIDLPRAAKVVMAFLGLGGDDAAATAAAEDAAIEIGLEILRMRLALPPKDGLDAVEVRLAHKRLMPALIDMPLEPDMPVVRRVGQDVVNVRAGEAGLLREKRPPFCMQSIRDLVKSGGAAQDKLEHPADVGGGAFVDYDYRPPILADVPPTVPRLAWEPPILHAAGHRIADIDRKLLGEERRHVGERPSHHPPGGIVLCWLRDRDEGHVVLGLQTLQFNEVVEIPHGTVYLVEEKAIERIGMLLGVRDHLLEDLALMAAAGSLGDAPEFDDLAARVPGIASKRVLLDVE